MNYSEKGVTIRSPSTANLMVDSADRTQKLPNGTTITNGTWGNFLISKAQSLFNGFFTRIGVTEVVLEWNEPNFNSADITSFTITVAGTDYTVQLEFGFKTVADCLDQIVAVLIAENIPTIGNTWAVANLNGQVALTNTNLIDFTVVASELSTKLGIAGETSIAGALLILNPDLRPYRYIDIVSSQLTYNQDLKDASTALNVRDVLCRWYFAYDIPPQLDAYGFPILMGYTPFYLRRIFNPPKQIKWDSTQPLGQISFEVYDNAGNLITTDDANNFLMTLHASEN